MTVPAPAGAAVQHAARAAVRWLPGLRLMALPGRGHERIEELTGGRTLRHVPVLRIEERQ